jgi:hypothetical protein
MNNEPVAWMVENDEDISFIMNGKGLAEPDNSWKSVTPVYTHPAKTLTDKDLIEQIRNHFNISPTASLTDPYPIRLVEILQYTKSIMPKDFTVE